MRSHLANEGEQSIQSAVETPAGEQMAAAVWHGLRAKPKSLPPWLFYDEAGSRLFEQITQLPEYYLTRTERGILSAFAGQMVERASGGHRVRLVELGAGSADKTRLLLAAAVERQGDVVYEPVDVSASALAAARKRIEREIPDVLVAPRVVDYTRNLTLAPRTDGARRMVLYIGSSIGNFDPEDAARLLRNLHAALQPGDSLLLGVDLVKDEWRMQAAYDDAAGVTAAFNLNLLARLNRELDADFDAENFVHRALWNEQERRMEMHLESRTRLKVYVAELDMQVDFERGERIHTENSYKYLPGEAAEMLQRAGFTATEKWNDPPAWFEVCLGRA